jgi:hypothetical protein
MDFQDPCFQSFACQYFGQAQAIAVFLVPVYFTHSGCTMSGCIARIHWRVTVASSLDIALESMETATIRKLRVRLLPFLSVLFALAFIDRINLGFAALTMNRELAGIALVTSVANLGGFAGPYTMGLIHQETGSFYYGLTCAGVSFVLSASLALVLPRRAISADVEPSWATDVETNPKALLENHETHS